jgi:hypothetical protein
VVARLLFDLWGDRLDPGRRVEREQALAEPGALVALARAGLSSPVRAAALLAEVEAFPRSRATPSYAAVLPAMVRTAVAVGEGDLAKRLATGVEAKHPYESHAVVAANAVLAEVRGDLEAATAAYADAASRWARFGVVLEEAFALLGEGRCLVTLGGPAEALPVLQRAREIFARLGAAPALAEAEALLAAKFVRHATGVHDPHRRSTQGRRGPQSVG